MESIALELVEYRSISTWKVHRSACLEVKKIMDQIAEIFTALELARPRCKSGLQLLCSLHHYMQKCKLLLRHCSESSKLYLAISGEGIILRCERIQNCLESYLSLLQNMVEPTLAAQMSQIVDYIKSVKFTLDSSEDEAGKVLLSLLHRDIAASKSDNLEEIKAFKFAAFRLQITSPLALMIEKRSIRKLLTKSDSDPAKRKILNYLLYLARKYGKLIKPEESQIQSDTNKKTEDPQNDDLDVFDSHQPPVNFKNRKLSTLSSSSSVPSFNSSLGELNLQVDHVWFRSSDTNSVDCVSDFEIQEKSERFDCVQRSNDNGTNLFILVKLSVLPWQSRRKAVEDVKDQLKNDQNGSHGFMSTSYIKPVFKFLKEAHRLNDSGAKRNGAELLLMFLKECRNDMPPLPKDAIYDLFTFLDSDLEITEEALQILEILSSQDHYNSEIVASRILTFLQELIKTPKKSKHHNVALRVLCNLSKHNDLGNHLIYLGFIEDLVPFLDEILLSGLCIKIFWNLGAIDEAAAHFLENDRCIESIGELLEVGKEEEQEHALDILISLYYQREELHEILMQIDGIISSLAHISKNGSCQGKLIAVELLRLLNNVPDDNSLACSFSDTSQSTNGNLKQGIDSSQPTSGDLKPKKSCSELGLFRKLKAKFRKLVR
ncbi:U-box domain-containing protein 5 [Lactuca sativa]|uniref:Uncharacterized protein n=1 Tax=Lactuca sativa TaxID=4236 RepID=A0A9R1VWD8_LACSA|nr:U-box domain-containing protein 5 [Lactuca sativa]KAJ0212172.1 hypothetical protein LSAT_V11C400203240 [Lactuca sativa]